MQVLCVAAGCLPLVSRYYSQAVAAKRAVMLTAAFGLLLILLRPPLPIRVSGGLAGLGCRRELWGWGQPEGAGVPDRWPTTTCVMLRA